MRAVSALVLLALAACPCAHGQGQPIFHDELLDHLLGRWHATGVVHGAKSVQAIEADWVLNHQFLRVSQKSAETVAGESYPYEGIFYIGYDSTQGHYIVHLVSVWGADSDVLGVGQRVGDEIRVIFPYSYGSITNRFVWQPKTRRWHILVQDSDSASPPFVDLEAAKASTAPRP